MAKPRQIKADVSDFIQKIDAWPNSWAGDENDVPIGEDLAALIRPFILHLCDSGLARKTIRRHLDNAWLIGGEIIRELHYDGERRRWTAERLLLEAVHANEAPLIRGATQAEQRSADTTARKLHEYLRTTGCQSR